MGYTFDVSVADVVFVRDAATPLKRGLQAVVLSDVVSVADKTTTVPAIPVITGIAPPRARSGESVTITGTGFSERAGQNEVRIATEVCTITAESATSITITVPAVFALTGDDLRDVAVENLTQGTTGYSWLWLKPPVADLAGMKLIGLTPGQREDPNAADPERGEAQDFDRLATLEEFLVLDTVAAAGDVVARDDVGLAGVVSGHPGQVLVSDAAENTHLRWGWELDVTLPFGGIVTAAQTDTKLLANGNQDSVTSGATNTRHYVAVAGRVDLLWLMIHMLTLSDTIDRIRIVKNGTTTVYDTGAGAAIGNATFTVFTAADLAIDVVVGDYLEVRITKSAGGDDFHNVGGMRLRLLAG